MKQLTKDFKPPECIWSDKKESMLEIIVKNQIKTLIHFFPILLGPNSPLPPSCSPFAVSFPPLLFPLIF